MTVRLGRCNAHDGAHVLDSPWRDPCVDWEPQYPYLGEGQEYCPECKAWRWIRIDRDDIPRCYDCHRPF